MNFPFRIERNDLFGRYLVASRPLRAGELILKETPLQVGPQIGATPICFKCCIALNPDNSTSCAGCGIALVCTFQCKGNRHTEEECLAIKKLSLKYSDFIDNPQIIMPLRCMLLNGCKLEEFLELESHAEARKNTRIWRLHKNYVEDVLMKLGVLTDEMIAKQLVQKTCGILDVNTFEIRPPMVNNNKTIVPEDCLRGVYLKAALMAHDCVSNTHLSVDDNFEMTVKASVNIEQGALIFFNYANVLQGTCDRRNHLRIGKYFECRCSRCSDASELGTDMSCLICPKCKTGLLYSTQPLTSYTTPWECKSCEKKLAGQLVKTTLDLCRDFIADSTDLNVAQNKLRKLKLTLGPNHYLVLEMKQLLISLYSESVSKTDCLEKINFCEEFIKVLEIIEPGISRLTGIALYELQTTKLNLARSEYDAKMISTTTYLEKLEDVESILRRSLQSLLHEPRNSPEGRLAQKVLSDLRILKCSLADIKSILGNTYTK